MRFLLSIFLIITIPCSLYSQKVEQGDFLFDLGIGVGIHNGYNNVDFSPNTGAASISYHITGAYSFSKNLTIGLNAKTNNFSNTATDSSTTVSAGMGFYYINADYYFINTEKFNLYGGFGFGISGLNYERVSSTEQGEFYLAGTSYNIKFGTRYFFGKHFGVYIETNYTGAAMQMKELIIDGIVQSDINGLPINQHFFNINGLGIETGISVRF